MAPAEISGGRVPWSEHEASGVLAKADVQLIRFLYCDLSGVTRAKVVTRGLLADKEREGIGLTRAQMAINLLEELQPIPGMEPVGEVRMMPDPATFTVLPWDPRSGSVLCDLLDQDGKSWGPCPRSFLKSVLRRAERLGISVRVSIENEFYLAREKEGALVPIDHAPVYSSIGLDLSAAVMHDIVDGLEAQGIQVESAINEYGAGQEEIAVAPSSALEAADRQIKVRDTVRGVALSHGYLASFAPKPFPEEIGSGAHIHFSLWEGERNLLYDPAAPQLLSRRGRAFVGGILCHLRALTALTCPNYNSYRRLQPHAWASVYTAWGLDNREAALRVSSPFRGREERSFNLELKAADPSANPYLALGGLILSGLDGIEKDTDPGEGVAVDPADLSDAEREARGIRPLPKAMAEALDELEADDVLLPAMGELLARAYLGVRRSEERAFAEHDLDFEIRKSFYRF